MKSQSLMADNDKAREGMDVLDYGEKSASRRRQKQQPSSSAGRYYRPKSAASGGSGSRGRSRPRHADSQGERRPREDYHCNDSEEDQEEWHDESRVKRLPNRGDSGKTRQRMQRRMSEMPGRIVERQSGGNVKRSKSMACFASNDGGPRKNVENNAALGNRTWHGMDNSCYDVELSGNSNSQKDYGMTRRRRRRSNRESDVGTKRSNSLDSSIIRTRLKEEEILQTKSKTRRSLDSLTLLDGYGLESMADETKLNRDSTNPSNFPEKEDDAKTARRRSKSEPDFEPTSISLAGVGRMRSMSMSRMSHRSSGRLSCSLNSLGSSHARSFANSRNGDDDEEDRKSRRSHSWDSSYHRDYLDKLDRVDVGEYEDKGDELFRMLTGTRKVESQRNDGSGPTSHESNKATSHRARQEQKRDDGMRVKGDENKDEEVARERREQTDELKDKSRRHSKTQRTSKESKGSSRKSCHQGSVGDNSTINSKDSIKNMDNSKTSSTKSVDSSQGMDIRRSRDKKSRGFGFHISPLMICTMCFCYGLSLLVMGIVGFLAHMFLLEEYSAKSSSGGERNSESRDYDGRIRGESPTRLPSHSMGFSGTNKGTVEVVEASLPSRYPSEPYPPPTFITPVPSFMPSTPFPSRSASFRPSSNPSFMPSTSNPSIHPSPNPSSLPSESAHPSPGPSYSPSVSPTTSPECPEQLLKSLSLGNDGMVTLNYEVVIFSGGKGGLGGLLCVSLEYAGVAGWLGIAFSGSTVDGSEAQLEHAVIGIPGVQTSVAVALDGSATLGQQNFALKDGPAFVNPAKYRFTGGYGFSGPSLETMIDVSDQTLMNGSVWVRGDGGLTHMSFARFLRGPNEGPDIEPSMTTPLFHAVAPLDSNGDYDGVPEWKSEAVNFL